MAVSREYKEQALSSPLKIILNPSGLTQVRAGDENGFMLHATISNQGKSAATRLRKNGSKLQTATREDPGALIEIDIYDGGSSKKVRSWCTNPKQQLALHRDRSSQVVFKFHIPADTLPDIYDYTLVIDAPDHYADLTPIDYSIKLQVLPFIKPADVGVGRPLLVLQPETRPEAPMPIPIDESVRLQAIVNNRSNRVDQFWLSCASEHQAWFYVLEKLDSLFAVNLPIAHTDMNLNPGAIGAVQLQVVPPFTAIAGNYTLPLYARSHNDYSLVLQTDLHIQLAPVYLLTAELMTVLGQVSMQTGQFVIRIQNQGNTLRRIKLYCKNAETGWVWTSELRQNQLPLGAIVEIPSRGLPGSLQTIELQITPPKAMQVSNNKWHLFKRQWVTVWQPLNFVVELEDIDQLSIATPSIPGVLLWQYDIGSEHILLKLWKQIKKMIQSLIQKALEFLKSLKKQLIG
ncbi:hypothetical protein ACKFKG_17600 [Phormidesmis sp. 146-35]